MHAGRYRKERWEDGGVVRRADGRALLERNGERPRGKGEVQRGWWQGGRAGQGCGEEGRSSLRAGAHKRCRRVEAAVQQLVLPLRDIMSTTRLISRPSSSGFVGGSFRAHEGLAMLPNAPASLGGLQVAGAVVLGVALREGRSGRHPARTPHSHSSHLPAVGGHRRRILRFG